MEKLLTWLFFWAFKYGFAVGVWFCIDDRLAAHFDVAALGAVPFWLVMALVFIGSVVAEQHSVVRVIQK